MRRLLAELGYPADAVSEQVVLVCPENFANRPTATLVDVRRQLTVLERQLSRITRLEAVLDALPETMTLDVANPPAAVASSVRTVDASYTPDCLGTCEMAYFCRDECGGSTRALGRGVHDDLGGVESIDTVLGLARGTLNPGVGQEEIAELLRFAHRLRAECLGGVS
jgi:hypothetical protein